MVNLIGRVAELIRDSQRLVAFTGAGISAESGIPTFRGEGGLWLKYDPAAFSLSYLLYDPEGSWRLYLEVYNSFFRDAQPNRAHLALAEMERMGLLKAIITQNVDSLHERAGSREIIKLHGDISKVKCLSCNASYPIGEVLASLDEENPELPPLCPKCSGLLKPDVVLFEEELPREAMDRALELLRSADLLMIIGTSGEVYPAGLLPYEAKEAGALIVEVNLYPSTYTYRITDYFLQGSASEVLGTLMSLLRGEES